MAAFAARPPSRFCGRRGELAGLIGCGVMRNLMIFAALMVVLGTVMAQMADKMTPATPALACDQRDRIGKLEPGELLVLQPINYET